MQDLGCFSAVYCSGGYIQDNSLIATMSILFDKIYIPNNIWIAKEFSKNYKLCKNENLINRNPVTEPMKLTSMEMDIIGDLTETEMVVFENYIIRSWAFYFQYKELINNVLETDMFYWGKDKEPFFNLGSKLALKLNTENSVDTISRKIVKGYVPVVERGVYSVNQKVGAKKNSNLLAALLAMKSVNIFLPQLKSCPSELILEARYRLSNNLPLFWASMLRLSRHFNDGLKQGASVEEINNEAGEIINTEIRPSLIDLSRKIQLEKKSFFHKVLSPMGKIAKLLIGAPSITHYQLIANSILLGSGVAELGAGHLSNLEHLKASAGLTFLLEARDVFGQHKRRVRKSRRRSKR